MYIVTVIFMKKTAGMDEQRKNEFRPKSTKRSWNLISGILLFCENEINPRRIEFCFETKQGKRTKVDRCARAQSFG